MKHLLSSILHLGVGPLSGTQASKQKITNVASFIACIVPNFYALYFYFSLGSAQAAIINVMFAGVYAVSLLLSYFERHYAARMWLFAAVMAHVWVLSSVIFTHASGFHFYYFLTPACVFLLFDEHEKYEKPGLMILGLVLFFACENYQNPSPMVVLSEFANRALYTSTIVVVMLEVYLVSYVFWRSIARNEQLLKELASQDPLTGLNNRRTFLDIGEQLISYANRYNKPLSLLLLDIDLFKGINDQFGHVAGDQVLQQVSKSLLDGTRSSDVTARYGGEEFVIILPNTSGKDAKVLAHKISEQITQNPVVTQEGQQIVCTVSVGVSELDGTEQSLEQLTSMADKALYLAKAEGRNQVRVFDSEVQR